MPHVPHRDDLSAMIDEIANNVGGFGRLAGLSGRSAKYLKSLTNDATTRPSRSLLEAIARADHRQPNELIDACTKSRGEPSGRVYKPRRKPRTHPKWRPQNELASVAFAITACRIATRREIPLGEVFIEGHGSPTVNDFLSGSTIMDGVAVDFAVQGLRERNPDGVVLASQEVALILAYKLVREPRLYGRLKPFGFSPGLNDHLVTFRHIEEDIGVVVPRLVRRNKLENQARRYIPRFLQLVNQRQAAQGPKTL